MNGAANGPAVMPIPESPGEARAPWSDHHHRRAHGAGLRGAAWIWLPTLSMMLATLVSYIDRNTLALLAPSILRDTGLSAQEYGLIVSAFSIAYVAGNLFWGRLLDRSGVLWVMAAAVALWSAASAAHALASGLLGFAAARALLGFAEGASFPGALRTVVQTLPPSSRSRGIGVAYSGSSLGALATPILVTPIALTWGWRAAFWVTGGIGVLWLLAWLLPRRRAELSTPPQQGRDRREDGLRWTDRRLWSFVGIYATGALPVAFVLYAAPLFLGQVVGMSQAELGRALWVPPLAMEAGFFFWGGGPSHRPSRLGGGPARPVRRAGGAQRAPGVRRPARRARTGCRGLEFRHVHRRRVHRRRTCLRDECLPHRQIGPARRSRLRVVVAAHRGHDAVVRVDVRRPLLRHGIRSRGRDPAGRVRRLVGTEHLWAIGEGS